jgi:5-methyltetrahydrofolate--homocysteine methyltransferase
MRNNKTDKEKNEMIIVGEKLNSSIPKTVTAINHSDSEYLIDLIKLQEANGADFLDINTAICQEDELSKLVWLIDLVQKNSKCGIMIDSPSPAVIKEAIKTIKDRKIIINSVTLTDRIDELLPVAKETGASIVGLPIDDVMLPETVEKRVANSKKLIEKITDFGIPMEHIYIDVLAEALSVGNNNALNAIDTIKMLKELFPTVKTICGLSNISFGLPKRVNINCAFLTAAVVAGLDSAIMDINLPDMKICLASSLAIAGKDDYCLDYISAIRNI